MVDRLPWALALATCGVWGCAAISGLDGLDLGGDASMTLDATTFDAPAADAPIDDAAPYDGDAGPVSDAGPTPTDAGDAGCASGKPCPGTQSGCCTQYETCSSTKPPVCCKSNGSYCNSSGDCCPGERVHRGRHLPDLVRAARRSLPVRLAGQVLPRAGLLPLAQRQRVVRRLHGKRRRLQR